LIYFNNVHSFDPVLMCEIKDLRTSFEITKFCPEVQKDKCGGVMSSYLCPHLVFNNGILIDFCA